MRLIEGDLPNRAASMAIEWATIHQAELRDNWQRMRASQPPAPSPRWTEGVMRPRITGATPEAGYRLYLTFSDGSAGTVDLRDQIVGRGGVFEPLERSDVFRQVRVERESGTVVWPNGVDLDADVLYSLLTGRPLPGSAADEVASAHLPGESGRH